MTRFDRQQNRFPIAVCFSALALAALATTPARAIEWPYLESSVRGYPVMRDMNGKRVADGAFVQWTDKDGLHVKITYSALDGRTMEETIVLRQRPELTQDRWQFRELQHGKTLRTFTVNLATGVATAEKLEDGEMKRWNETLDVERGKTFAGFGFTMAAKALRTRLMHGETVELKAIGFTPQPKAVTVELSYAGRQTLRVAGRSHDTNANRTERAAKSERSV
jgi:hypothetical protein